MRTHDDKQRNARDLSSDVRDALEKLLAGLFRSKKPSRSSIPDPPMGSERDEVWLRLLELERIDKTAARVANVPESELDALIDEAVNYVRYRPAAMRSRSTPTSLCARIRGLTGQHGTDNSHRPYFCGFRRGKQ